MDKNHAAKPAGLWPLFKLFLRIGATGFGGLMALLALLQEQLVERRKWVSGEEFADGVAIGQLLPGPIVVDAATHFGYRLKGWRGALLATMGLILPAFLLMLVITPLYFHFGDLPRLTGAFQGIGAAIVALVVAADYRLGQKTPSLRSAGGVLIAGLSFAGLTFLKIDAVLLILLCGAAGVLFLRPRDTGTRGHGDAERESKE